MCSCSQAHRPCVGQDTTRQQTCIGTAQRVYSQSCSCSTARGYAWCASLTASTNPQHITPRLPSPEERSPFKRPHKVVAEASPQPAPTATLYATSPDGSNHPVPAKQNVVVGRLLRCDLVLKQLDVSGTHCHLTRVQVPGLGLRTFLLLTDVSRQGTFVNGVRVNKLKPVMLQNGDKVGFAQLALYILRYHEPAVSPQRLFYDSYALGKLLGTGHYAQVKQCSYKQTGAQYAVKIFQPQLATSSTPEERTKLNQELEVLKSISHRHVVRMVDAFTEPVNNGLQLVRYLVLEMVNGGELFQRIVRKSKLRENELRAVFTQLLEGLRYLHSLNIVHRDIKPENVLLSITSGEQTAPWDEGEHAVVVKIADFGLAKCIGELSFTSTLCGTPAYVAPEVMLHQLERAYSKLVDLWLAGVLLYVCLCGFPPFSDELAPPLMRQQILTGQFQFYSPYWDDVDDAALDLVSKMLVVDPAKRILLGDIQNHPWTKGRFEAPPSPQSRASQTPVVRPPVRQGSMPLTLSSKHLLVPSDLQRLVSCAVDNIRIE